MIPKLVVLRTREVSDKSGIKTILGKGRPDPLFKQAATNPTSRLWFEFNPKEIKISNGVLDTEILREVKLEDEEAKVEDDGDEPCWN